MCIFISCLKQTSWIQDCFWLSKDREENKEVEAIGEENWGKREGAERGEGAW
jgi:hypothetical protein